MIKTVIIDDDVAAIDDLKRALLYYSDVDLVAVADNYKDAKIALFEQKPDLVFLDVEMPGKTGFELLQEIRQYIEKPFYVVFYTAFEKYVIRALRESAFDFLLKPVERAELKQIIEHYHRVDSDKSFFSKQVDLGVISSDIITLPTLLGLRFLRVNEIVFFQHRKEETWGRSYWYVHLYNQEMIRLKAGLTSSALCEMFKDGEFIQLNQSTIINISFINSVEIKSKQCLLLPPFESYRFNISRNCMGKIRERFEYL